MCSIMGSFSKVKIKELVKLNQYRGNFSFSITVLDIDTYKVLKQIKEFGEFNFNSLNSISCNNAYFICHVQAPTNSIIKDINRIHPTEIKGTYLWHNGIITPKGMFLLNQENNSVNNFDTLELHNYIYNKKNISNIEGLFSCLYLDNNLKMFRTKHGKLYIDNQLNISSERFDNSKCINYDSIYNIDLKNKKISLIDKFKTKKFNIVIKGEL